VAFDVHEELLAVMFCHGGAVAFCFNCVFHTVDGGEYAHLAGGRASRPVEREDRTVTPRFLMAQCVLVTVRVYLIESSKL